MKPLIDATADAVAREIASLRREAKRERELQVAEHRATLAELETRLANVAALERQLADRLAALKDGVDGVDGRDGIDGKDGKDGEPGRDGKDGVDGKDGTPGKDGRDGVDGKDGLDGKDGRDGHDVDDIIVRQEGATVEFEFHVADQRTIFEIELPEGPSGRDGKDGAPGKDGKDGADGRDGADGKDGLPGERGDQGPPGKLNIVEQWAGGVHYEGDVRAHNGATWQALKDTADEPGSDDWICIAARGADGLNGEDGASLNPRGLWAPADSYKRLDIVALDGGAFIATKDEPGPCPGPDWKLLCQRGKRGERGEKGEKGERGERGLPAEPVVAMSVDDEGMVTLTNGDGTQIQCDFYPVLSKIAKGLG